MLMLMFTLLTRIGQARLLRLPCSAFQLSPVTDGSDELGNAFEYSYINVCRLTKCPMPASRSVYPIYIQSMSR